MTVLIVGFLSRVITTTRVRKFAYLIFNHWTGERFYQKIITEFQFCERRSWIVNTVF